MEDLIGKEVEVTHGGYLGSIGKVVGRYRECGRPYDVRIERAFWYGDRMERSGQTLTLHTGEFRILG